MESINLHFTGDIHALTAAHNLLSAALDNHLHQGNEEGVDVRRVDWPRARRNDRALRETVVGLGGPARGVPREDEFVITAASELMAVLGLAEDLSDLKTQIGRIVLAEDADGDPVTPDDLGVTGPRRRLLRDAFRPNLVQTIEGVPALVHGGPFANIAHRTNTLVADRVGASLADYLVTEAGFGADLGAEKFAHIVARGDRPGRGGRRRDGPRREAPRTGDVAGRLRRAGEDRPRGGASRRRQRDTARRIVESLGIPAVVGINVFPTTRSELAALESTLTDAGIPVARSTAYRDGGEGRCRSRSWSANVPAPANSRRCTTSTHRSVRRSRPSPARCTAPTASSTSTAPTRTSTASRRGGTATSPVCVSKTPYSASRTTPR